MQLIMSDIDTAWMRNPIPFFERCFVSSCQTFFLSFFHRVIHTLTLLGCAAPSRSLKVFCFCFTLKKSLALTRRWLLLLAHRLVSIFLRYVCNACDRIHCDVPASHVLQNMCVPMCAQPVVCVYVCMCMCICVWVHMCVRVYVGQHVWYTFLRCSFPPMPGAGTQPQTY